MEEYSDHSGNKFQLVEILPCPFCGSDAELKFTGNDHTKSRKAIIRCINISCRCTMTGATMSHYTEWIARIMVNNWNKRDSTLSFIDWLSESRFKLNSDGMWERTFSYKEPQIVDKESLLEIFKESLIASKQTEV